MSQLNSWGLIFSVLDERHFLPPKERSLTVCSKADSFRPSMSSGSVNSAPQNRRKRFASCMIEPGLSSSMRSSMRHPLPPRVIHKGLARKTSRRANRQETQLIRVLTVVILKQIPRLPPPILTLIGDAATKEDVTGVVTETISSAGRTDLFRRPLVVQKLHEPLLLVKSLNLMISLMSN